MSKVSTFNNSTFVVEVSGYRFDVASKFDWLSDLEAAKIQDLVNEKSPVFSDSVNP